MGEGTIINKNSCKFLVLLFSKLITLIFGQKLEIRRLVFGRRRLQPQETPPSPHHLLSTAFSVVHAIPSGDWLQTAAGVYGQIGLQRSALRPARLSGGGGLRGFIAIFSDQRRLQVTGGFAPVQPSCCITTTNHCSWFSVGLYADLLQQLKLSLLAADLAAHKSSQDFELDAPGFNLVFLCNLQAESRPYFIQILGGFLAFFTSCNWSIFGCSHMVAL